MAEQITPRNENYSQWYVDLVLQAKLADYSPVKGTMVIRPRGYALWEKMQRVLDGLFKETGHTNAYFPLLIPQSFIQKEADHVEGFSPELAVVTHGGGEELDEPLVIRPTSETIIWSMYKKWIQSYRDLPLLINQWANVLRWEKRTRLFLRTMEFLWQEGHTAHATKEEAEEETLKMLDVYRRFAEEYMAIPVLSGRKSESEKFAGAINTYSIEAMMQDKKALQAGTSHFLGQNFAKAFDVTFQNTEGELEYVWASSWGVSTRLVGALIMAHSDDNGLVLPPKLAPLDTVIIPIYKNKNKQEITDYASAIFRDLRVDFSVEFDNDENSSPGYKFAEWELYGVPVRIEIGPKDMEKDSVMLVRRDTREKISIKRTEVRQKLSEILETMQKELYQKALQFRNENSYETDSYEEFQDILDDGGFITTCWCGNTACEEKIKQDTKATIRVLDENRTPSAGDTCVYCGGKAKYFAVFAKSY